MRIFLTAVLSCVMLGGVISTPSTAYAQQSCVREGFGTSCARLEDLGPPTVTPAQTRNGRILVDLNMREWPSYSGRVLAVLKKNACMAIGPCSYQADGWWCVARHGGQRGYVKKIVFDNKKQPLITFRNHC